MYLFGASGHCKVIIDIINKSNFETIEGVFDDNPLIEIISNIPVSNKYSVDYFINKSLIIAIGNNNNRRKIVNRITANYQTAIHPNSIIASDVIINKGSVIMAGAIINPNVYIGSHCIINSGSIVEHDCTINDFVHISPNASVAGFVSIGEGTHVGIGAVIIQGLKIGKWTTIGAGTVVLDDIPDYSVVVGNPGKVIKYNPHE
jgi:sugar O-acyltransferase (sialic acid O-acetyltransferase NeuD family)